MARNAANDARWDPQPPDKSSVGNERLGQSVSNARPGTMAEQAGVPQDNAGRPIDLLGLMGRAESLSREFQTKTIEKPLATAYRAWNNEHAQGSKYLGKDWQGRSRLFVPKTRSAVRKNIATAAAALFSTQDVVNVEAEFQDDDVQRAAAAVLKADMDYRLSRPGKSGIPWYQIALGACQDGQLTGTVVSKQYWEYEAVPTGQMKLVMEPALDPMGQPMLEPAMGPDGMPAIGPDGLPAMQPMMSVRTEEVQRVTKDRPAIDLIPIENVGVDPAAPWVNPAQLGRWFYVDYPMGLSDARAMMASGDKSGENFWLEVDDATLLKGRSIEDRAGARRTREGGADRYEDAKAPGDLDIVWIRENFLRISGRDYHFWSVGRQAYLSQVRETHEVYPELDGERPYVFGVSQLDAHRVFPMSPVTAWQPLQLELNDITNLRQDTLKRAIAPLAIVKRGKKVDIAQVQRRGQPETVLSVDDPEKDVTFVQTPGPTGAAYTETSVNNAMFDELAGVFSTSSVQSNRQLNETVGGMRLMSNAANAVSEFDLRMWIETWVEPVLRHIMLLIRVNESDERLLMLAGQKAQVMKDFGFMPALSEIQGTDIMLRVNAGIGALDPMQKLTKLKLAMEMLLPMASAMAKAGIKPNFKSLIEEIMGSAGFKDGLRFFEFDQSDTQLPPEVMQAMAELKLKAEELEKQFQEAMLKIASEERQNTQDNATAIEIERMKGAREVFRDAIGMASERAGAEADRSHEVGMARESQAHQSQEASADRHARIKEIMSGAGGKSKSGSPNSGKRQAQRQPSPSSGPSSDAGPEPQLPTSMPTPPAGPAPSFGPTREIGFPSQLPQGQPTAPANAAIPNQLEAGIAEVGQLLHHILQQLGMNQSALQALVMQQNAASELVRDATGNLIGMRKGGQFQQFVRGADGRINGAAPLGGNPR